MRHASFVVLSGAMIGVLGLSSSARATQILRNDTALVSGNFNTTASGGGNTVGTNPVAEVGSWITIPDNSHGVFIANDPSPGSFEGDGYLEIRNNDGSGGSFDAAFTPITTVGDAFHWRSKVYVPAAEMSRSDDYQFTVRVTGTAGFPGDYILLTTIRNGVVNAYNGSTYVPTATTLVADQWSTWDISYTRGASTFSWLVNGAGDTAAPTIPGASGRNIGYVNFFGNYTGGALFPLYLDALDVPPPPANDACASAQTVGMGQVSGTTFGASNDGSASCGNSGSGEDVYYSFTPATSGNYTITATATTPFVPVVSVHTGCPAAIGNQIGCTDAVDGSGVTVSLNAATTYLIRVAGYGTSWGNFTLTVAVAAPPPANDACGSAQTVGTGQVSGTTRGASNDGDASCGNSATSLDVYYAFTPATSGSYTITACSTTAFTPVVSVHTGCPAGIGNELGCSSGASGGSVTVSLTAATAYLIRVAGSGTSWGDFTLTIAPAGSRPHVPFTEAFETAAVGSNPGWEIGFPALGSDSCTHSVNVINTDASPSGGGQQSLDWSKPAGGVRGALVRRWQPLASSTTGTLHVSFDFKIVQHTSYGLIFVVSGWDASDTLDLNVYSVRFDSSTDDGVPIGWNYLDNGAWNNFIPVASPTDVIGHWFHYDAMIMLASRNVDLTITQLDGPLTGHILGSFQTDPGVNPLDADLANYQGLSVFQSQVVPASEVRIDNLNVQLGNCHDPVFDADGDGDVDMDDFGAFQRCYTGDTTPLVTGCECFDWNGNNHVDSADFDRFKGCASGAGIPANPACDD